MTVTMEEMFANQKQIFSLEEEQKQVHDATILLMKQLSDKITRHDMLVKQLTTLANKSMTMAIDLKLKCTTTQQMFDNDERHNEPLSAIDKINDRPSSLTTTTTTPPLASDQQTNNAANTTTASNSTSANNNDEPSTTTTTTPLLAVAEQQTCNATTSSSSSNTEKDIIIIEQKNYDVTTTTNHLIWMLRFKELKQYKSENGHVDILVSHNNMSNDDNDDDEHATRYLDLAMWAKQQRKQYTKKNNDRLQPYMINLLNDLGFHWEEWDIRLNQLMSYKAQFGHTNVPLECTKFSGLGLWVKGQRKNKKRMNQTKISKLEQLGFEWSSSTPAAATAGSKTNKRKQKRQDKRENKTQHVSKRQRQRQQRQQKRSAGAASQLSPYHPTTTTTAACNSHGGRGRGRGRNFTLPAWMTNQTNPTNDALKPPPNDHYTTLLPPAPPPSSCKDISSPLSSPTASALSNGGNCCWSQPPVVVASSASPVVSLSLVHYPSSSEASP